LLIGADGTVFHLDIVFGWSEGSLRILNRAYHSRPVLFEPEFELQLGPPSVVRGIRQKATVIASTTCRVDLSAVGVSIIADVVWRRCDSFSNPRHIDIPQDLLEEPKIY
jgi:hypothetical protein